MNNKTIFYDENQEIIRTIEGFVPNLIDPRRHEDVIINTPTACYKVSGYLYDFESIENILKVYLKQI
jgi:hypothetical protein